MKKRILLLALLVSIIGYTQNGINYKALIKDDLGNAIVNSSVDIKFQILESDAQTNVYEETHSPTTDDNGIIIVNIGEGTIISGVFEDINWGNDNHFLNVKIDTGSGFADLGTTQFSAVPYAFHAKKAANVKGLEPLDEGNGIGWRLVDRNADNYDNIGRNAIDFSFINDPSLGLGATGNHAFSLGLNGTASGEHALAFGNQNYALNDYAIALGNNNVVSGLNSTAIGGINQVTGDYAFAAGRQNEASANNSVAIGAYLTASGYSSTAMGVNTTASGIYAFTTGNLTTASGEVSTSLGYNTEASGDYSVAMGAFTTASEVGSISLGYQTEASGSASVSLGIHTEASGNFSTAMGLRNTAPSYAETTIGSYSTEYNPLDVDDFNMSDRLFTIGNGIDNLNRSNAVTVLKNGNTGIGTSYPQELLHISGGRLRIGTETIEDTGSNRLSFNATLLPDLDDVMNLGNSSFRWNAVWSVDGTINTSDRREKKNIKNLNYGLAEILQMQPVSFNWKNQNNPDVKLGLIAQDLLKLTPEVVKTHVWETDEITGQLTKKELNRLGVHYSDLVPVLIKAIQEQNKLIENQKKDISQLKSEVSSIKNLLTELKITEQ